ncbi:tetratricopeptide repeat protein [Streptomyces sp. NPDC048669]|uniref:AfsR/SARP family transcriptional regulator n=1 Tax=Streptomyces sp. NPDC048669 TaxID=3155267 RepID=UPI00342CA81C
MEFHILGPVLLGLRGDWVDLGSDKERIVLASLALDVGRPVALATLMDRLWEGDAPPRGRAGVHTYVSRLRRRIRRADADAGTSQRVDDDPAAPRIIGRAHTYELEMPPDGVDWYRYQRLVEAAAVEPEERTVELLRSADALWRGEALSGLPGLWAETVRTSLAEHRLAATITRSAAQLRLGDYVSLISELPALAQEHPQDETLLGQLAVAYYGSGRFVEALRILQQARHRLLKEYGARPSDELNLLHRGVLDRRPVAELVEALTAPSNRAATPVVTPSGTAAGSSAATPRALPHQPPLVGRHRELAALTDTVTANGSVVSLETVSGMPGVGKTALSVHAAERLSSRFPDGQLYLNLRAHSPAQEPMSPGEALSTLLRMLGAPASAIPVETVEQVSLWRAMMAERRAIVVLDDAASATQVRPLLPAGSPSLVIIASRRHLTGIPEARSLLLDVMSTGDAIALFRSFAGEERTQETAVVGLIAEQCGLLPLAIELVANRFRTRPSWTLTTLSERLSREPDRLGEIHDADNDVARAFDLSYRDLSEVQRSAFRLLSLHPGADFTPDVAAAMLDLTRSATERVLEALLACHLLREPTPDRYRYHDLLRVFARQLATAEDTSAVRSQVQDRVTHHYLHAAHRADQLAYPRRLQIDAPPGDPGPHLPTWPNPDAAKAWLSTEHGNLLAAERHSSTHGDTERAARLGYSLSGFLDAECHWHDEGDVLQRAGTYWLRHGPEASYCRALLGLTAVHTSTGRYPQAGETGTRALEIARSGGDSKAEGEALRMLGTLGWSRGENTTALRTFQESLAIQEASGDLWETSRLNSNIGVTLLFLGQNDRAHQHFEAALAGFRDTGDRASAAKVLNNVGDHHLRNGDLQSARLAFEEALAFLDSGGNRYDQATVRSSLADVLMELGETHTALDLYLDTLQTFQSLGDKKSQSEALVGIGEAHRAAGNAGEALKYHREALEITLNIGAPHQEAQALRGLGRAEFALGRLDSAAQHLRSAAATAARIQDLDEVSEANTVLADVLVASGDAAEAHSALRSALDALGNQRGHSKTAAINQRLAELDKRFSG